MLRIALGDRPLPDGERWTAIADRLVEPKLIMLQRKIERSSRRHAALPVPAS